MWVVGRLLCRSLSPLFYLQQLCKQSVKVLLKTCLSKWLTDRRHLLREASGFGISKNSRKSPLSKPGACNSCACAFSLCREARPRCSRGHHRRSCWGVFREELWLCNPCFLPHPLPRFSTACKMHSLVSLCKGRRGIAAYTAAASGQGPLLAFVGPLSRA